MRSASTLGFFALALFFLGVTASSTLALGFGTTVRVATGQSLSDAQTTLVAQFVLVLTLVGPLIFLGLALNALVARRDEDGEGQD